MSRSRAPDHPTRGSRRGRALRTAALVGLVIAALLVMGRLAWWQFQGSLPAASRVDPAATRTATPLTSVLEFGTFVAPTAIGQVVTAAGRYLPEGEFLSPAFPRPDAGDGTDGPPAPAAALWIVTPLQLIDGRLVAVVRGTTAPGEPPPAPPRGPVTVTGYLQPSQPPTAAAINTDLLVRRWAVPMYDGYVILAAQQPPSPVPPVSPGEVAGPSTGIRPRNLAYAVQWLIFAGFAVYLAGRVIAGWYRPTADPD